jgi:hypothetical protein
MSLPGNEETQGTIAGAALFRVAAGGAADR